VSICDAGNGCIIECKHDCVARWDDLNICEKRCLDPAAPVAPMKLEEPFSLALHCSHGNMVAKLFDEYLPNDLLGLLNEYSKPIELELIDCNVDMLVAEIRGIMGGLLMR